MMMSTKWIAAFVLLLVLAGCKTIPVHIGGGIVIRDDNLSIAVMFSEHERRLIHNHYRQIRKNKYKKNKHKKMPPGLAKRDRLPPGLRKQLRRKGQLPPGLQGRGLPPELVRKLSPAPKGHVRLMIGGNLVLMNTKTRVIVDLVKDLDD